MVLGLRSFTERTKDGAGEPVLDVDNGEELMHVQPSVDIVLGNRTVESRGTLYISTKKMIWLSDVDKAKGYAVDFLSLSLHAVSRDPEAYPVPCIYTQIETEADEDESDNSDSDCNDALDLSKIREMRLVPSDPSQCIFWILCLKYSVSVQNLTLSQMMRKEKRIIGFSVLIKLKMKKRRKIIYFTIQQTQLVSQMEIMTLLEQYLSFKSTINALRMQRRWSTMGTAPVVEFCVCFRIFSASSQLSIKDAEDMQHNGGRSRGRVPAFTSKYRLC